MNQPPLQELQVRSQQAANPNSSDNLTKAYQALSQSYDVGTPEEFAASMKDSAKLEKAYGALSANYDVGTLDEFRQKINPTPPHTQDITPPPPVSQSKSGEDAKGVWDAYVGKFIKERSSEMIKTAAEIVGSEDNLIDKFFLVDKAINKLNPMTGAGNMPSGLEMVKQVYDGLEHGVKLLANTLSDELSYMTTGRIPTQPGEPNTEITNKDGSKSSVPYRYPNPYEWKVEQSARVADAVTKLGFSAVTPVSPVLAGMTFGQMTLERVLPKDINDAFVFTQAPATMYLQKRMADQQSGILGVDDESKLQDRIDSATPEERKALAATGISKRDAAVAGLVDTVWQILMGEGIAKGSRVALVGIENYKDQQLATKYVDWKRGQYNPTKGELGRFAEVEKVAMSESAKILDGIKADSRFTIEDSGLITFKHEDVTATIKPIEIKKKSSGKSGSQQVFDNEAPQSTHAFQVTIGEVTKTYKTIGEAKSAVLESTMMSTPLPDKPVPITETGDYVGEHVENKVEPAPVDPTSPEAAKPYVEPVEVPKPVETPKAEPAPEPTPATEEVKVEEKPKPKPKSRKKKVEDAQAEATSSIVGSEAEDATLKTKVVETLKDIRERKKLEGMSPDQRLAYMVNKHKKESLDFQKKYVKDRLKGLDESLKLPNDSTGWHQTFADLAYLSAKHGLELDYGKTVELLQKEGLTPENAKLVRDLGKKLYSKESEYQLHAKMMNNLFDMDLTFSRTAQTWIRDVTSGSQIKFDEVIGKYKDDLAKMGESDFIDNLALMGKYKTREEYIRELAKYSDVITKLKQDNFSQESFEKLTKADLQRLGSLIFGIESKKDAVIHESELASRSSDVRRTPDDVVIIDYKSGLTPEQMNVAMRGILYVKNKYPNLFSLPSAILLSSKVLGKDTLGMLDYAAFIITLNVGHKGNGIESGIASTLIHELVHAKQLVRESKGNVYTDNVRGGREIQESMLRGMDFINAYFTSPSEKAAFGAQKTFETAYFDRPGDKITDPVYRKVFSQLDEAVSKVVSVTQDIDQGGIKRRLEYAKEIDQSLSEEDPSIKYKIPGIDVKTAKKIKPIIDAAKKIAVDLIKNGTLENTNVMNWMDKAVAESVSKSQLKPDVRAKVLLALRKSIGEMTFDPATNEVIAITERKMAEKIYNDSVREAVHEQLKKALLDGVEGAFPPDQREKVIKTVSDILKAYQSRYNRNVYNDFTAGVFSRHNVMTRNLGAGGSRLVIEAIRGDNDYSHFLEQGYKYVDRAREILESTKDPVQQQMIGREVAQGLEARDNPHQFLLLPQSKEMYKVMKEYFDFFRERLKERGYKTLDDYFPHMKEMIDGSLNKFISTESPRLKARRSEFSKTQWTIDPLTVMQRYLTSVSRELAYKGLEDYYYGSFKDDVPLVKRQFVGTAREYMEDVLSPTLGTGVVYKALRAMAPNFYRSALAFNIKASVINMTQRDITRMMVNSDVAKMTDWAYRNRKTLTGNFARVIEDAKRDTPKWIKQMQQEYGRMPVGHAEKIKGFIDAHDTFQLTEIGNWRHAEIAGILDAVTRRPEWDDLVVRGKMDKWKAVDEILKDPKAREAASRNAAILSSETQVAASPAMRGKYYDQPLLRVALMFTQFKFRQWQLMSETLRKSSGADGARALGILKRGITDEVAPVEMLREIETTRKSLETALKESSDPRIAEIKGGLTNYIQYLKQEEAQLNEILRHLQPRTRTNYILRWSKYYAKIAAISMGANYLFDNLYNAATGKTEQEIEKQRSIAGQALQDVVGLPWSDWNPHGFMASPLMPDLKSLTFNGDARDFSRELLSYGIMMTSPLGIAERATKRGISSTLIPKGSPGNPYKMGGGAGGKMGTGMKPSGSRGGM